MPGNDSASLLRSAPDDDVRVAAGAGARRWPGLGWARQAWWAEIIVIGLGYVLYEVVQGAAPWRHGAAFLHAHQLVRFESWLSINPELAVDHLVNAHDWLAVLAGYYYDSLHYLVTPAVLLWLFLRRPVAYGRWRSALIVASVGSLAVFWLWPLAPPRMAVPHMVDTLAVQHILGSVEAHSASSLVNDFAAMPSLHVGWALWCAAAIVGTVGSRWRHLAWLYPVATTLVVMGTGNHYLLDAVGGALAIGVGLLLTAGSRLSARGAVASSPAAARSGVPAG